MKTNKNLSKNLMMVAGFLGLFLISVGISVLVFSLTGNKGSSLNLPGGLEGARAKIAELPKDQQCPINGQMLTKVERDIWEQRRPVTAVIENHLDARPLSGISKADVMYEAVAEGGITRYLGVFHCNAASQDLRIGVVRSARVYFINWAAEYGKEPIFLHWGGANRICQDCPGGIKPKSQVAPEVDALSLLSDLGWRAGLSGNDYDGGTSIGFPVVVRDRDRLGPGTNAAYEHSPVAFLDLLHEDASERGYSNEGEDGESWDEDFETWKFKEGSPVPSPSATSITYSFWENAKDYDVTWEYDKETNSYLRFNGDKPTVDFEFDNTQVTAKNVVVQFVEERGPVDSEKHMYYENIGTGNVLVFQNGDVIKGTWEKESRLGRTKYLDDSGKEIEFVGGMIWISAVPDVNKVDY